MRIVAAFLALFIATSCPAATYYVKNGGDDNASGRSHGEAWGSLGKVNSFAFSAGDVVLFHEGHRWVGQLVVDWAGTSSSHAVVGAYHVQSGTAVQGFASQRPVIDGAAQYPSGGMYDAIVMVNGRDRVRIENIAVRNSEGRGVGFKNADFGEVVNVVVDGAYVDGIHFLDSDNGRVQGSLVTHAGLVFPRDGRLHPWAAAITFVNAHNGHVVGNTVAECYGEGINANHGSRATLIERNRLFAVRAVGIYSDGSPGTTIRRNIVVGTSNSEFWRTSDAVGAGIAINNERYHYSGYGGSMSTSVQSRDAKVYGNLVANTSSGVALWGALPGSSHDNLLILNNTLIDNTQQISGIHAPPAPGGKIYNNVLLSLSPGTVDVDMANLTGIVARNNYFSQGDPGGTLSHSGNRYDGIALSRMSNWRALGSLEDVRWQDFASMAGSSTIASGDDEPLGISSASDSFNLDFNEQPYVSPMDMGGIRHGQAQQQPKAPRPPTNVYSSP